ncbi:MAG: zf-HC2 domain-containing protein [Nannocystaceae bacterium]
MIDGDRGVGCEEFVASLQAFVDGELSPPEQEAVSGHVIRCGRCRASVQEQQNVRATLRALAPLEAPVSLRARVLARVGELDKELDQEEARARTAGLPWIRKWWACGRAFLGGGVVMAPAAVVALFMGMTARQYLLSDMAPAPALAPVPWAGANPVAPYDGRELSAVADATRKGGAPAHKPFEIQLPRAHALPPDVELVGASNTPDFGSARANVEYADRSRGRRFVDYQQRGGRIHAGRSFRVFRGRHVYYFSRDDEGRPLVQFVVGDVLHMLRPKGARWTASGRSLDLSEPDFRVLVDLGEALGQRRGPRE